MSHEQTTSIFLETYRKYEALQDAYQFGYIDFQKFQDELAKLEIQLDNGDLWRLSEEGYWYWYDGTAWVQREPPKTSAKPEEIEIPIRKPVPLQEEKKNKFPWALVLIPIVLIVLCAVIAVILYPLGVYDPLFTSIKGETQPTEVVEVLQEETPRKTPTPEPTEEPTLAKPTLVLLSEHQQLVYDDFGWPDAFTIMESDDLEGNQLRHEFWNYYQGKTNFIFADGNFQVDTFLKSLPEGYLPSPYHPNQFPLGISFDQLQMILPEHQLVLVENTEDIQSGLTIYASQQAVFSFIYDHLFYIETFALIPEEGE
jgi:hypothetical protein